MSATLNGRPYDTVVNDSLAERCGRIIDRGMQRMGIKDLRSIRVNPTKLKDVMWAPNGSTAGRAGRRMDLYPDVRGMHVADIAAKLGVTLKVAGRVAALQMRKSAVEAAKK